MFITIKNAILPYINESDPLWEEIGVESVIAIFETFSSKDWERFIQEVPDDIPNIDVKIIDCLTQMSSDETIKAAVKIAMTCSQGAFTLFVLRLDDKALEKIPRQYLVEIEKKAQLQEKSFQGKFATVYKESVKNIQKILKTEI